MVEFGITVQEAVEAAHVWSYQMRNSFGDHRAQPGLLVLHEETPCWVCKELKSKSYTLEFLSRASGPITAIYFDQVRSTFWGGASDYGEDYGIAWQH